MERKVTKIGRSHGITLPSKILEQHGIQLGDKVEITSDNDEIVIKKSRKVDLPEGISEDFFEVLENNIRQHDETIKGLVDR